MDTMTAIVIVFGIVLLAVAGGMVLLYRKVEQLVPEDEKLARAEARASKSAARTNRREERRKEREAKRSEREAEQAAEREPASAWRAVAVLAIVALVLTNVAGLWYINRQQAAFEESFQALLEGDVDQSDLNNADIDSTSVPDEVQDRLDLLQQQLEQFQTSNAELAESLEALRTENDELEQRLNQRAEDGDLPPPAQSASLTSDTDNRACPDAVTSWFEAQEFGADDFRCGDFIDDATERGDTSFSESPLRTTEELVEFLNASSPEASAARAALRDSLPEDDYRRALRGEGYVLTQVTVPAQYEANTYYRHSDGSAVFITTPRTVEAGDLLWVYTNTEGEVVEAGNIRADCGNARAERIVPTQPKQPDKPVTPQQPDEPDKPDRPDKPDKPDEPKKEEPKCFDDKGKPVFDGKFCGTPGSGPEQQGPRDDEVDPTPGYNRGDAEETRRNQDEARKCIEAGDCDPHDPTRDGVEVPDSKEGGKAPGGATDTPNEGTPNPEHDGTPPTQNPDAGTSDPVETPAEQDEDVNQGDPGSHLNLPNVP